jgi:hypothetical protein
MNYFEVSVAIEMGWTTEGSENESRCGQKFYVFRVVQTDTRGPLTLIYNGYPDFFSRAKNGRNVNLISQLSI